MTADSVELITNGYSNRTYRVRLGGETHVVAVQFAVRDAASAGLQAKVFDLLRELVPVPEVLWADPDGGELGTPVLVTRWVSGHGADEVLSTADAEISAEVGEAVGRVIAETARLRLDHPGYLAGPHLDLLPRRKSLAATIRDRVHRQLFDTDGGCALEPTVRERFWYLIDRDVGAVEAVEGERSLVHGDLAPRNILIHRGTGTCRVVAVLDWEFALAGPHLLDVGHVLRGPMRHPSAFESALAAQLDVADVPRPENWRQVAWLLDAFSLTGPLGREPGHPDRESVTRVINSSMRSVTPWQL